MVGEHLLDLFFGNGCKALEFVRRMPFILSADVPKDIVDILEGFHQQPFTNSSFNFGFDFKFLIFINILVDQM